MKNDKQKSLLDQDIDQRIKSENAEKPKITPQKEKGRWLQASFAILLAILVLIGILYPLFNLN
ncbi:hypothetical protein [Weissella uvarum]|uniref:hypothetical protein n=1 Tax=Weissella uvarum TaxID=1479233 RepID=UPI001961CBCD|nr:hypothetical protein [Weissella uvarum]MCM0594867.1 hypothetical protein [Weissella uvarum]